MRLDKRQARLTGSRLWKCYAKQTHPRVKFSLKKGTIFEDSPLGLDDKWFSAMLADRQLQEQD